MLPDESVVNSGDRDTFFVHRANEVAGHATLVTADEAAAMDVDHERRRLLLTFDQIEVDDITRS